MAMTTTERIGDACWGLILEGLMLHEQAVVARVASSWQRRVAARQQVTRTLTIAMRWDEAVTRLFLSAAASATRRRLAAGMQCLTLSAVNWGILVSAHTGLRDLAGARLTTLDVSGISRFAAALTVPWCMADVSELHLPSVDGTAHSLVPHWTMLFRQTTRLRYLQCPTTAWTSDSTRYVSLDRDVHRVAAATLEHLVLLGTRNGHDKPAGAETQDVPAVTDMWLRTLATFPLLRVVELRDVYTVMSKLTSTIVGIEALLDQPKLERLVATSRRGNRLEIDKSNSRCTLTGSCATTCMLMIILAVALRKPLSVTWPGLVHLDVQRTTNVDTACVQLLRFAAPTSGIRELSLSDKHLVTLRALAPDVAWSTVDHLALDVPELAWVHVLKKESMLRMFPHLTRITTRMQSDATTPAQVVVVDVASLAIVE